MKYYDKLIELGCFSRKDLVKLTGSASAADSLILRGLKVGVIARVHRDLYCTVSLETKQPVSNRWQIATSVSSDAAVVCHSALEFYGFANQVFYEVSIASRARFRDFVFQGVSYHRLFADACHTVSYNGVRVTDLEQTVVDCIKYIDKCAGFEETIRCFALIPSLDADRLLRSLRLYDNGFLYQKTACMLSQFDFSLPDSFFDECELHLSTAKKTVSKAVKSVIFSHRWQLFCPSVSDVLNKGAVPDVLI